MLKGKLGWKGERGFSAYEVAVQNGFIGSEQDWLDTIGCPISSTIDEDSTNGTCAGSKAVYDFVNNRVSNNDIEIPIYAPEHEYTLADADRITNIYLGQIEPTENDYRLYDLDFNGKLTMGDAVTVQNIVNGRYPLPEDRIIGKFIIKSDGGLSKIEVVNTWHDSWQNIKQIITPTGYTLTDIHNNKTEVKGGNIEISNSDSSSTMSINEETIAINSGVNQIVIGRIEENVFGYKVKGGSKTTTVTENGVSTVNNS